MSDIPMSMLVQSGKVRIMEIQAGEAEECGDNNKH